MSARLLLAAALAAAVLPHDAWGGAFIFADEGQEVIIAHPPGYTGSGGVLSVSVCVHPGSAFANEMLESVENTVDTWQALLPTTGTLSRGGRNEIPPGTLDFESVMLHELGHCLGLAHPNLGTESGVGPSNQDFTRSTDGADDAYGLGLGADDIRGTPDDQRGDDVNLHWFEKGVNNPFVLPALVDSTTFSRLLSDLPPGDDYAANGERNVAVLFGFPDTEAVMQQGTRFDEEQRDLTADDVATLRYATTGLDEIAGTGDDYTLDLDFLGLAASCDIVVDFDNTETGFAVCTGGGQIVSGNHARITNARIYFNDENDWFFRGVCGNGGPDPGETCDDGNATPGDGCDAACQTEPGYACSGIPSMCGGLCGDGVILAGETCDDGNASPGDGCDDACQIEGGFSCSGEPSSCTAICGDSLILGAETCDDGGLEPGDGCDASCSVEPGFSCSEEPSVCGAICGDGVVLGAEGCDDGALEPGDGCDAVCQVEPGYGCSGEPSSCALVTIPALPVAGRALLALALLGVAAGVLARARARRSRLADPRAST